MNSILKTGGILLLVAAGIFGILYYAFLQIDFVGHKDPKTVEENVKRWKNTLLSAEFRKETDHCEINLLDAHTIEINVGDAEGAVIFQEEYKVVNDTIVVLGGIEHAKKYLNSSKFVIQKDKLLYKLNSNGSFDTLTAMTIKFNKLKTQ